MRMTRGKQVVYVCQCCVWHVSIMHNHTRVQKQQVPDHDLRAEQELLNPPSNDFDLHYATLAVEHCKLLVLAPIVPRGWHEAVAQTTVAQHEAVPR